MSYYEKQYKRPIFLGRENNALVMLIAINLVIFVLFYFIEVFYQFTYSNPAAIERYKNDVYSNLAVPANLSTLLQKPWTLITYMFYHFSVWHIIGNMLSLWAFGYIMHDLTGNRKLVPVFLYGGLAGAAAYLISYNLVPAFQDRVEFSNMVGASAGIMAVAMATTAIAPGYRIFPMLNGGIPLWVLTMIYVIIDIATIPGSNSGGHIAHLGGALAGFLFIFFLRRGYDGSEWMNNVYDWVNNLFNPNKPSKQKAKQELFYKATTQPFKKTPNLTQQKIDEILDKIHQKGYNHLTEEEKNLLKRASEEDV